MPNVASVHIDRPLTNLTLGLDTQGYIAQNLLPGLSVGKQTDIYWLYDPERESLRQKDDQRAPGSATTEMDFKMSTAEYTVADHALGALVTDQEIENADSPLRPVEDRLFALRESLEVGREIAAKKALDDAITQTATPTNNWADIVDGDPIGDVTLAVNAIENAIGKRPNVLQMNSLVFRALQKHPQTLARVAYSNSNDNAQLPSTQALAQMFFIDKIVVAPPTFKNTAVEGQTASLSRIWDDNVYCAYVNQRPGMKNISLGWTFYWEPFAGTDGGWLVDRWRKRERRGEWIEMSCYRTPKITTAAAGYVIKDTLT